MPTVAGIDQLFSQLARGFIALAGRIGLSDRVAMNLWIIFAGSCFIVGEWLSSRQIAIWWGLYVIPLCLVDGNLDFEHPSAIARKEWVTNQNRRVFYTMAPLIIPLYFLLKFGFQPWQVLYLPSPFLFLYFLLEKLKTVR